MRKIIGMLLLALLMASPAMAYVIRNPYQNAYYNSGVLKQLGSEEKSRLSDYDGCVETAKTQILYNSQKRQIVSLRQVMKEYNAAIKLCYTGSHYVGNPYKLGTSSMALSSGRETEYTYTQCLINSQKSVNDMILAKRYRSAYWYGGRPAPISDAEWIAKYNEARKQCDLLR